MAAVKHRSPLILVLGGSGFVGRRLVAQLARRGCSVRIATRSRARSRALLVLPEIELRELDVHDEAALTHALQGCDTAINLVGILNERGHDGRGFERAHTELAHTLVRACRRSGVRRLLQMSALHADAEYGASHYLRSKGRAERVIATDGGADIAYTIFRPSVIFGAEDSFINRFAALLRRLPVLPLPRAAARFAPVFVDDVAQAFAAALFDARTRKATYELCGPDVFSLEEIVRFARALVGAHSAILPLPDALGRVQAWVGEYLLPGKPFSLDNFASLSVASVCSSNGIGALGIEAQSLTAIVPTYLGGAGHERRLARLRQSAGRG